MKRPIQFLLFITLSLVASCKAAPKEGSGVKAVGIAKGEFRGLVNIEKTINSRILAGPTQSAFSQRYVEPGTEQYMGQFQVLRQGSRFVGGSANSLSILLWYKTLGQFSRDLAAECGESKALQLQSPFAAALKSVCEGVASGSLSGEHLSGLWQTFMRHDAVGDDGVDHEYDAWKQYYDSSVKETADRSTEQKVEALMVAGLMNPFFLLK